MTVPPLENAHAIRIRDIALSYAGAVEEFPWGERAFKINKKVFLYLSVGETALSITAKLPISNVIALDRPEAKPTGYGLGPCGWVTFRFPIAQQPPFDEITAWVNESFRAVATKRVLKALELEPLAK